MGFFKRFFRHCWTLVIPLLLVIVGSIVLVLMGHRDAAMVFSNLGTVLVILGNLIYIAFFDSRKRWKGSSLSERLIKLFTFQR